jgi:hypothetical protein
MCESAFNEPRLIDITSGDSARSCVRVDQCVSAVRAVEVFLRTLSGTSVARMRVGHRHFPPGILDNVCCLSFVAAAGGWDEVDTVPLIHDVYHHTNDVGET